MPIKQTVPTNSGDYLQFGNATTPVAAQVGGYEDSTGNGHLELYTTASGTVTERMRIDANGNVGIGTASPSAKLDINTGANTDVLFGTIAGYNRLSLTGSLTDAGASGILSGNTFDKNLYVDAASSSGIVFRTNGSSEKMRIDSSGNVGIGSTSPAVKLEVNAGTTSGTSYNALVLKGGANSTSGSGATMYLSGGVGTDRAAAIQGLATDNQNAHAMVFYTNPAAGALVERMRIDANGNLLIGTTSNPGSGDFKTVIDFGGNGRALALRTTLTTSRTMQSFLNGNGEVGHIDTSGTTTSYVTSSDYRLKENVVPMTGALEKVALLKPVTYTWKADGTAGQGFIAHELQEVVPDCVSGEKDEVYEDGSIKAQGIDTSFLVATLTAAIQEQQVLIQSQAAAISNLTERIAVLETK